VTGDTVRIESRRIECGAELLQGLQRGLNDCPDLAFAHLPQVFVPGRQERPELVLFVWFLPAALRSLRSALDMVSETVAGVLPEDQYIDVVVLNSAPELLLEVERAASLLVERSPAERARALSAARAEQGGETPAAGPWWWPFGRRRSDDRG
jgi:hypothetical protein